MATVVTQELLLQGFHELGIQTGDVVLAHSAMRTFGHVENGADAVIDALLEVIGPRGTLVVPTFTFSHEAEEDPLISPDSDRSEMGIITETARRRLGALRSIAFRHSFASLGRRAAVITGIDPALSVFDLRSSFGVMLGLNTQVLLLGVTYTSSTSHHFAEMVCEVSYRQTIPRTVKVRRPDGSTARQLITDYQPKGEGGSYYGSRGPDFNRLGKKLEDDSRVSMTFIGNAAVRRFSMRNLIDFAQKESAADYNIFRTPEGKSDELTPLDFGDCVISPQFPDGAGRPNRVQWCVRDPAKLQIPE
jgi:aminoglycoside 3-N-acetyltransferase